MHQLLSIVAVCHRLDLRVLPCGFLLCLHLFTTLAWGASRPFSPDFCPPPPLSPAPSLSPDLVVQEHLQHGFTFPCGRSGNGQSGGVWLRNRPRRKKIGEKEEKLSFAFYTHQTFLSLSSLLDSLWLILSCFIPRIG